MKKFLVSGAAFLMFASLSMAGVEDNKAIRAGNEEIKKSVETFAKNCGKTMNKVEMEKFVTSKHESAGKMKYDNRESDNLIKCAADICGEVIRGLADICNDPDYKGEVSKLTGVSCTPVLVENKPYWVAKKSGTTLAVTHHVCKSWITDGIAELKKAF